MKLRPATWIGVGLAAVCLSCAAFGPATYESDTAFKQYVTGLHLSGLTGQAAVAKLTDEGFQCQTVSNVIQGSPEELVLVCVRHAAKGSCAQDQQVVLRLDWVGTPRPSLAPGMRVRDVGSAMGQSGC